jgi:hypothetical protein
MSDIREDYRLRDLIEKLEATADALDEAVSPGDLHDAAADAAATLAEATNYLIDLREQRLRPAATQQATAAFQQLRRDVAQRTARKRRTTRVRS